jgi:hypothetical protein
MDRREQTEKENRKVRETLLVIVLGFGLLYLILDRPWLLYVALGTGVAGMLSLSLNRVIHKAWFFMGEKLGWVVSKLVLGAIFLLVLIPTSLLARVFRRDAVPWKKSGQGTYHPRNHDYEPSDLENMW